MSTTVLDICKEIPILNEAGVYDIGATRRGEDVASVADGLKPAKVSVSVKDNELKALWVTPEQALSIIIPRVEVNSRISGYQRDFYRQQARRVALGIREGKVFPPVSLSIDGHGAVYGTDGQHRIVGHVIEREPVAAVIRRLTKEQQRQLFSDQGEGRKVDRNVLILAGRSPYDEYIQDAITSNTHPWGQIVSANPKSRTRIGPYAMQVLLIQYVGNTTQAKLNSAIVERWDEQLANEMAPLIACFGNKQTNPQAFRATSLRAIGETAMHVFRRNETVQESDHERWVRHMPMFRFDNYIHVRRQSDMTYWLVAHWNKKLHEARKVSL